MRFSALSETTQKSFPLSFAKHGVVEAPKTALAEKRVDSGED